MQRAKAAVLEQFGRLTIREFPVPEVAPDAMLVKMRMVGICGTDKHLYDGRNPALSLPIILGHENLGEVAAIGKSAQNKLEVNGKTLGVGDRVTWFPAIPCGDCWYCKWLGSNYPGALCENARAYGINISSAEPPHLFGGYAEYVYITPGTWVWKIPEELPDDVAVLTDIFSVMGVLKAMSPSPVTKRGFAPGDVVAIQGAGPMGFASGIIAKLAGAGRVILVGGPKHRLELAETLGVFDQCINIEEVKAADKRVSLVRELSPGGVGPDLVVDCTGVPGAVPEGLDMVRRGGTFVELGSFVDTGETTINPFRHLCWKDVNLIGNFGGAPHSYDTSLRFLEMAWKKGVPLSKLVTHRFPLSRAQSAMDAAHKLTGLKIVIVPD